MINERNGHKTRFKNYQKLYSHINSHQQGKRFNTPNQLIDDWFFARHSHRRVMAFYEFASIQKRNSGGKIPKLDVLEMSYDCSTNPVIMPITSCLDIESLIEDWCRRYCESNGYKLVEIQDDGGVLHVKRTPPHHPLNGEQSL